MKKSHVRYQQEQDSCDLKAGDRVLVTRRAKDWESGWRNSWDSDMDDAIGGTATIVGFLGKSGIELMVEGISNYLYPYFVLEKVIPVVMPKMDHEQQWYCADCGRSKKDMLECNVLTLVDGSTICHVCAAKRCNEHPQLVQSFNTARQAQEDAWKQVYLIEKKLNRIIELQARVEIATPIRMVLTPNTDHPSVAYNSVLDEYTIDGKRFASCFIKEVMTPTGLKKGSE